jgi:hypothetical protein
LLLPVAKKTPLEPGQVATSVELAAAAGVSVTTVKTWRGTPGFPEPVAGPFSVWAVCKWRAERDQEYSSKISKDDDIEELERVNMALKNEALEIKNRKLKGDLVSRTVQKSKNAAMFNEVRVQLEAAPGFIGASVPPEIRADVVHELEQQVRLILRKLANKAKQQENE